MGINCLYQDKICSLNKSVVLKVKICVSFSFQYTIPLYAPASNFVDMLTMIKELRLDYEGQRSKVNVTMDIYGNSVYTI